MPPSEPAPATLTIAVCYALPAQAWQQVLCVPSGTTLAQALAASDFQARFPGVDPFAAGVGVFGVPRSASYVLHDGDRIEVYRPLVFDPMESRRRRAQHKAARKKTRD